LSGNVNVKSTPGQGTTFFVHASMRKAETLEIAEETPERSYNIAGKVWLVDDDAFILKWCSSVLELNGIPHTSFSSAEEVLSRPWDKEVKFVLTDMRMSGMNGAELCKRLRKSTPDGVKFFVLTAQALPEERENLLSLGFDGYLMKPFHSTELLELLENYSPAEPPKPIERAEFDFSMLNEMTFGDEGMIREILDQFVKDSRNDVEALHINIETRELEKVQEIMHRMAGRTGQIGARELSAKFRALEIALREDSSQVSVAEMKDVVANARLVIGQMGERALSYSM
jgi:CheY-like chemotaxis protein